MQFWFLGAVFRLEYSFYSLHSFSRTLTYLFLCRTFCEEISVSNVVNLDIFDEAVTKS